MDITCLQPVATFCKVRKNARRRKVMVRGGLVNKAIIMTTYHSCSRPSNHQLCRGSVRGRDPIMGTDACVRTLSMSLITVTLRSVILVPLFACRENKSSVGQYKYQDVSRETYRTKTRVKSTYIRVDFIDKSTKEHRKAREKGTIEQRFSSRMLFRQGGLDDRMTVI